MVLPGVIVGLLLFVPLAVGASPSSSPQDNGIFTTNTPVTSEATLPTDFQESVVFSGLTNPTAVRFASASPLLA